MLERQRKETILRLLELHRFISVRDALDAVGASESTIRRDFTELESEGRVIRVRGGVELRQEPQEPGNTTRETGKARHSFDPSFVRRAAVNAEKKRRIAARATAFLKDGETIFLDGGTTTFDMVEHLIQFSMQVVTNSFAVARFLLEYSRCRVILPEGAVNPDTQLILSNITADPFANYSASCAFMSVEGITDTVLTNNDSLIIQAERAMIAHSRELIILADDTKFGRIGSLTLCPVDQVSTIITTVDADPGICNRLEARGVRVIRV